MTHEEIIAHIRKKISFRLRRRIKNGQTPRVHLQNFSGFVEQLDSIDPSERWELILNPLIQEYSKKYIVVIKNDQFILK